MTIQLHQMWVAIWPSSQTTAVINSIGKSFRLILVKSHNYSYIWLAKEKLLWAEDVRHSGNSDMTWTPEIVFFHKKKLHIRVWQDVSFMFSSWIGFCLREGSTADIRCPALPCYRDFLTPSLRIHRFTFLREVHKWSCGEN